MRVGESFVVFNGQGGEYEAEILSTADGVAQIQILAFVDVEREPALSVHLGQCLSRGERMDYAIQKSVEVGVTEITPLFSERCNVKLAEDRIEKRMRHWQQVIISACEQSGRLIIPTLHPPMPLREWVSCAEGTKFICDFQPQASVSEPVQRASVLIGPEGGFDETEVAFAHEQGFQSLTLGKLTLRTETAPVVALTRLYAFSGV